MINICFDNCSKNFIKRITNSFVTYKIQDIFKFYSTSQCDTCTKIETLDFNKCTSNILEDYNELGLLFKNLLGIKDDKMFYSYEEFINTFYIFDDEMVIVSRNGTFFYFHDYRSIIHFITDNLNTSINFKSFILNNNCSTYNLFLCRDCNQEKLMELKKSLFYKLSSLTYEDMCKMDADLYKCLFENGYISLPEIKNILEKSECF